MQPSPEKGINDDEGTGVSCLHSDPYCYITFVIFGMFPVLKPMISITNVPWKQGNRSSHLHRQCRKTVENIAPQRSASSKSVFWLRIYFAHDLRSIYNCIPWVFNMSHGTAHSVMRGKRTSPGSSTFPSKQFLSLKHENTWFRPKHSLVVPLVQKLLRQTVPFALPSLTHQELLFRLSHIKLCIAIYKAITRPSKAATRLGIVSTLRI